MVGERVRRDDCRIVLFRNIKPKDPSRMGRWEVVSTGGWVVLCPTPVEAISLMLIVGPRLFGVPRNVDVADPRYGEWLQHDTRMRIERHIATGKGEVLYHEFVGGWCPTPEERLSGRASHLLLEDDYIRVMRRSEFTRVVDGALRQALTS